MKKFILFALCASLSLGMSAAKKASKKKSKAPVEVVDTVCVDTFSYYFGRANSNGLKGYLAQRMGVDTAYVADFLKGFEQTTLTEADKKEKARLAGIEIRQQVEEQVYPGASKQINDSTEILNKALFVKGFRDNFEGVNNTLSMDSTQKLVKKQMEYYHKVNMEKKYGANRIEGEEFLKANAKKDSVKVTPSGLQYKILTQGTGEVPTKESKVKVNYEGHLIDGTEFDSSYKRNKPVTFPVSGVIAGWTEALCMMPVGSKWMLYVPQELAYKDREQAKIPPFSCLIFTVELLEIEKEAPKN
jgi:FKBP-type peptidyl-prolyl cis-trans isomerase FklB